MAVLQPSAAHPHRRPSQQFLMTASTASQIPWILSPALTHSRLLYLATGIKYLLSNLTPFILLWCHSLSRFLLWQAVNTLVVLQYTAAMLGRACRQACLQGWRRTEWLRKRLFFEFMVFVLGGGNPLFLVIFWPGWFVLSVGALTAWAVCG